MSTYWILFFLPSLMLCYGVVTSIQAPFFPIEAFKKGASISQFSPVFGTPNVGLCLASPFFGTLIRVMGVDRAYKFGVFLPSLTCILFGFLTFVPSTTVFLVLAYILRLLEGVGGATLWNSTNILLLARFPNSSAGVYSLTTATFGFGSMCGPTLGSFLFKAGGFLLPFLVSGVSMALIGILSIFSIREVVILADNVEEKEENKKISTKELLYIPSFIAGLQSAFISGCSFFFTDSLLEPFLSQFNLDITTIGLSFLAMTGPYTCTSLLIGWLNDRYSSPWLFSICGLLINLIGFILVGPSPYLPLSSSYPLTLVGLMLIGCGIGVTEVASNSSSLSSTYEAGYEETLNTYSIVSGVWISSFAFGNFMGPTIGGLLYDQVGFPWATVVIQIVTAYVIVIISCIRLKYRFGGLGGYHRLPDTKDLNNCPKGEELTERDQLIWSKYNRDQHLAAKTAREKSNSF